VDEEHKVARDIGCRVRELRRTAGLTQQALADLLDVEPREVRRIEAGGNTTVFTLVRVAQALDAPVASLFERPQSRTKPKRGRPKKT